MQMIWICWRRVEITEGIENQLSITRYFTLIPILMALLTIGSSNFVDFVIASLRR